MQSNKIKNIYVIILVILIFIVVFLKNNYLVKSEPALHEIAVKNADINKETQINIIELIYCDDNKLIFKDYYGVFIYSFETCNIIKSLDVEYINCSMSEGDNACQFRTYDNGRIVELYTTKEQYYFVWEDNILYTDYNLSKYIEDENDNIRLIGMENVNINACSFNYVECNNSKLYLTCEGEEGILNNLLYVLENENGDIVDRNYIFRN